MCVRLLTKESCLYLHFLSQSGFLPAFALQGVVYTMSSVYVSALAMFLAASLVLPSPAGAAAKKNVSIALRGMGHQISV